VELTTKQKENILNGKRYSIITKSLKGDESHELIIDLNYAWYLTMKAMRS